MCCDKVALFNHRTGSSVHNACGFDLVFFIQINAAEPYLLEQERKLRYHATFADNQSQILDAFGYFHFMAQKEKEEEEARKKAALRAEQLRRAQARAEEEARKEQEKKRLETEAVEKQRVEKEQAEEEERRQRRQKLLSIKRKIGVSLFPKLNLQNGAYEHNGEVGVDMFKLNRC
ncbi:hypothetical protein Ciccas_001271 [Cichlidogyrus casuarinus]|uniref:Uncharacterized protein n=1 Tax=Cichlidogyrus casuarinus TaxID=1844966 RepID=A0ABD2QKT4_9PLAT